VVAAGQEIDARVRHAWPPQGQRHPNTRHRIGLYVGAESRVMPRRNFAENTPEYGGRGGWSFIDATFVSYAGAAPQRKPHVGKIFVRRAAMDTASRGFYPESNSLSQKASKRHAEVIFIPTAACNRDERDPPCRCGNAIDGGIMTGPIKLVGIWQSKESS
jgi:hypothetical protein